MRLLNLGCGSRFHPDWLNLDFTPAHPSIMAHDLRRGIPFPDATFDGVYHSHVLEHFPKRQAPTFLRECHRVLKPGGVLRVAVPDLERIAQGYLQTLEASLSDERHAADYDWMMLELYDQSVRDQSGGEMLRALQRQPLPNQAFILARCGEEARRLIAPPPAPSAPATRPPRNLAYLLAALRERLLRLLLGREYGALQLGRFRLGGEVHLWMYDRYSLAALLRQLGFQDPRLQTADQSLLPNWSSYHLDTNPDGSPYKPDSLYMEAVKGMGK